MLYIRTKKFTDYKCQRRASRHDSVVTFNGCLAQAKTYQYL